MTTHAYRFLLLTFHLLLLAPLVATAAVNRTWDGSASGNWSNGANWVGGVAPAAGDSLTFPVNATRYVTTNNFAAGMAFGGIAIHGSNYFFRGNSLVLEDDLRALAQGGSVTFDLAITINSPNALTQFESRFGSLLRFNNTLHIADANHPLQFIDGVIRVAGAITGPGRIEAISGDLYFDGSAVNTFDGTLELSIGNLFLNKTTANAAIPPGCIVERGGTAGWVRWLRDEQVAASALFTGLFLDLNNQTETVNDFNTSSVLTNGTLFLNGNILGATVSLSGDGDGRIHLNPGNHQLISTNGGTLRNELTGPGNLVKMGDGWMWMENSNTFTGQFIVSNGLVAVRHSHALGSTNSGTIVHEGATLMLRNNVRVVGETLFLDGTGHYDPNYAESLPSGFGALHAISPSNAWTGPIVTDEVDYSLVSISVQAEGLGPFQTNSLLVLSGPISGNCTVWKEGKGTLALGGTQANAYVHGTTVREGTLRLDKNGASAISPSFLTIGTTGGNELARVEVMRGGQIPDTANVTINPGGVLDMNNQSDIIAGLILDDGEVDTGTGALIISGSVFVIDSEILPIASRIRGNGRLLFSPAAHDITLIEHPANDFALEISCEVGGSGALSIKGDGSLFLGHSNSFSGLLTMSADTLGIADPNALGGAGNGTIVHSNSTVALYAVSVPAEPLTLRGGASLVSAVEFPAEWGGPVVLPDTDTTAVARGASSAPGNELTLSGIISGPGDLRIGGGRLMFSGNEDNTQTGDVRVEAGTLMLAKVNANAVVRRLVIGHPNVITPTPETVLSQGPNQIADDAEVRLHPTATWLLNEFDDTIGSLGGAPDSLVRLGGSATLTVEKYEGVGPFIHQGIISGSGNFVRTGPGYSILAGDNQYLGLTRVESGWLEIWGSQPQSHVTIASGGNLGGFGIVGHLHANAGSTFAPGYLFYEPVMTTSNLTLLAGSTFRTTLWGPGTNQSVRVRGGVTLNSPTLELNWNYIPNPGDTFKLIDNDGNDAVNGIFAGIPGGLFTAPNGMLMEMTYGNDVTLRVVSPGQSTLPPGIGIIVTGGNGNGAIDPNECNQLRITIYNNGTNDLPPFKTMLVTDMAEANITQAASDYPAIPVNGSAVNVTPFQISTTDKLECGTNIPARLLVLTANGSAFALDLPLPTGLPSTPVSYHANPNAPVLDGILTESVINVPAFGNYLASVEVSLLIEHTRSSDLQLSLVAPDGTEVLLAEDLGNGVNYGTSCAPNARTRFADSAANSITGASAPFVGTFRPQNYLATFRGMPGTTVAGNWKLRVNDHVHFNTGFLRCWSLTLAPATCTDGGGMCEPCPGPIVDSIVSGAPVAAARLNTFTEASNCFSNKPCPSVVNEASMYRTYGFTNLSSQPSCVSVIYTPQCDVNPQFSLNVVAYLESFNPADVTENFLASAGTPLQSNAPRKFSFKVPGHAKFEMVVSVSGNPACAKYQLEVLSPDLCPVSLNIAALNANTMRLDWPSHAGGYELQRTPALLPVNWNNVTNAPVITNGRFTVTNEVADPNGFYRLRKP